MDDPQPFLTGSWHNGYGNYLFGDGHVRAMTLRQTLLPKPLWDHLDNWCPQCDCLNQYHWSDAEVVQVLQLMGRMKQYYP
jgi:prepilin-type processing-associated H-X9-DG protein